MILLWRLISFALVLSLAVPQVLARNSNADSELKLGIAAYEKGHYSDAIEHLERAVTLDAKTISGHFYLAESYDGAYSEECDSDCETNERRRVRAIEEYNKVLELEPSNTDAMNALAWRYYRNAQPEEADRYYRKVLEVDPNDFEALYTLAVIEWRHSYQIRIQKRVELKLARNKTLIDLPSCIDIRTMNLVQVDEGVSLLTQADSVAESYDGKVYLSLLYRERADIECGDRTAYEQDLNSSIEWTRRACDARNNPAHISIPCTSLRCSPPAPPPAAPGQPDSCPIRAVRKVTNIPARGRENR